MSGVDARTLQTLGGWRSLGMVERYSHLSPDHLRAALDRLVAPGQRPTTVEKVVVSTAQAVQPGLPNATELDSNLTRLHDEASRAR
jgi:hypothetical protein